MRKPAHLVETRTDNECNGYIKSEQFFFVSIGMAIVVIHYYVLFVREKNWLIFD